MEDGERKKVRETKSIGRVRSSLDLGIPDHNRSLTFRESRELLNEIKPRRQRRQKCRDFRHSEGESRHNVGTYRFLSEEQFRTTRERIRRDFPNAIIDVASYRGINQGQDGACTLVSLIHMIWLSGASFMFSEDLAYVLKNWRRFWKPTTIEDASPDIGSTMDMAFRTTGLLKSTRALNYVPIRSEGNREQSFNESFWTKDTDYLVSRYKISPKSDYDKIPYVYQNAYLIERLLDAGYPIALNALEHSRVAISYNETHLLFADSWDTHYYETNKRSTDVSEAGFSVVDKWLIYSWMRDVAYAEKVRFDVIGGEKVNCSATAVCAAARRQSKRTSKRRRSTNRPSVRASKRASSASSSLPRLEKRQTVVDLTGEEDDDNQATQVSVIERVEDEKDDADYRSWIVDVNTFDSDDEYG